MLLLHSISVLKLTFLSEEDLIDWQRCYWPPFISFLYQRPFVNEELAFGKPQCAQSTTPCGGQQWSVWLAVISITSRSSDPYEWKWSVLEVTRIGVSTLYTCLRGKQSHALVHWKSSIAHRPLEWMRQVTINQFQHWVCKHVSKTLR